MRHPRRRDEIVQKPKNTCARQRRRCETANNNSYYLVRFSPNRFEQQMGGGESEVYRWNLEIITAVIGLGYWIKRFDGLSFNRLR